MKKYLLGLIFGVLFFSFQSNATHIAGGEMYYEYIGPNPGGAGWVYEITLILYGDSVGVNFGTSQNLTYTSSCNNGGNITLNANGPVNQVIDPNNDTLDTYRCAAKSAAGAVVFTISKYSGQVIIPTVCADWRFFWTSCCRNFAISNIVNPGGAGFYIEARLNNNLGQNSSPVFQTPPVKQFCVNTSLSFPWPHLSLEPDGDSLEYVRSQPRDNFPLGALIPWAPGYSTANPITPAPGTNMTLTNNGTVIFKPGQVEIDVFKIDVEEFRFSPSLLTWIFVGSSTREVQVPIVQDCIDGSGPELDSTQFSFNNVAGDSIVTTYNFDSISNSGAIDPNTNQFVYKIPIIDYNCFDSTVVFELDKRIRCGTLTESGSEFRIIGPDQIARPIVRATANCDVGDLADRIVLHLHRKLDENGRYLLYTKPGFDGNTLWDECGFPLDPYYTMLIDVKNCPTLEYSLDHLTVVDDKKRRIEWSITDPSYLQPDLFNFWQIGMSVGGATYFRSVDDINARSFEDDVEFMANHVDHQNFTYSVQLVQNADFKAPAMEQLTTVRLRYEFEQIDLQNKRIKLGWNSYNGWENDTTRIAYQAYLGNAAADSSILQWTAHGSNNVDNFFTQYDIDESTTANDGLYAFKVEATDITNPPPAGRISESNWIFFTVGFVPLPDLRLRKYTAPNVFTPNDDNRNDRFFIQSVDGGREYADISLSVFNRWGQLVYEDTDFGYRNSAEQGWDGSDIYTGKKVSDGVYYYMVKMFDPETGTSEDLQGSVTITTN